MKNILIKFVLTISFFSTSSALAEKLMENFYFKLEQGISAFDSIKEGPLNINLKSKAVATIDIGLGFHLKNKFKFEVSAGHVFSPTFENKATFSIAEFNLTPIGNIALKAAIDYITLDQNLINFGIPKEEFIIFKPFIQKTLPTYLANSSSIKNLDQLFIEFINGFAQAQNYTPARIQNLNNIVNSFINNINSYKNSWSPAAFFTGDLSKMKIITPNKRQIRAEYSMIKAYIDLAEFNNFKVFIGGGAGISLIQEKISRSIIFIIDEKYFTFRSHSEKPRAVLNFAYMMSVGTSYKINENIATEIAYNYKDLGKTPSTKTDGNEWGRKHYKSHSITAALRFNF